MAKTLNQFLEGYLKVKNPDEQKFVDKHVVAKHSDRNGNGDEVFKGSKVKPVDRRKDRHGYNPGEDEKVYEELQPKRIKLTKGWGDGGKSMKAGYGKLTGNQHKIDANKNGKVDAHDFKLLRKKKKVAEEAEQIDELSDTAKHKYLDKADKYIMNKTDKANWRDKKTWNKVDQRSKIANKVEKDLKSKGQKVTSALSTNEEAEQIDELSNDTLRNYRMKAKHDVDMKGPFAKDRTKSRELANRKSYGGQIAGIKKARVMASEEVEELDEVNTNQIKKDLDSGMSHDAVIGKHANKRTTNTDAIRKVIKQHAWDKRMKKEEVEELDELSHDTLRNYRMKAKSIADHGGDQRTKGRELAGRKSYGGRMAGIEKAKVMAKEEVEELDEKLTAKTPMGTYVKDFQKSDAPQFKGKSQEKRRAMAIAAKLSAERGGKPLRKEEKLASLLDDLAESQRNTMLVVFEKLNETNQKKFLEACETPEGVEYMLDFAISHRGE